MIKLKAISFRIKARVGFTLIELIVSISIFATISGVMVANLRQGRMRDELTFGATNLVEAIRDANNRTISGELAPVCFGGPNDGDICPPFGCGSGAACMDILPTGGFGVFVSAADASQYDLFADLDGDLAYENGELIKRLKYINSGNVILKNVSPANPTLTIAFRPPKPTAYINGGVANSYADIVLGHKFSDNAKTVRFERISGAVGIK
ncbi:prepilin-type N-terminal cleavage/methylation domain-containing protein [Candidatus Uhrbacteria bacterium]|nr:prepilin-type N-terminal cleavage/methylation domain-containing protein [Candidatus Uhrbacteria bacterium]